MRHTEFAASPCALGCTPEATVRPSSDYRVKNYTWCITIPLTDQSITIQFLRRLPSMPPPPHTKPENVLKVSPVNPWHDALLWSTGSLDNPTKSQPPQRLQANMLMSLIPAASTGTHRSRAVSGCSHNPPRTCHVQAIPEQPHHLPRACYDSFCGAVCRPQEGQTGKRWSIPVQEHCAEHQRGNHRGRSPWSRALALFSKTPLLTKSGLYLACSQKVHRTCRTESHRSPSKGGRSSVFSRAKRRGY